MHFVWAKLLGQSIAVLKGSVSSILATGIDLLRKLFVNETSLKAISCLGRRAIFFVGDNGSFVLSLSPSLLKMGGTEGKADAQCTNSVLAYFINMVICPMQQIILQMTSALINHWYYRAIFTLPPVLCNLLVYARKLIARRQRTFCCFVRGTYDITSYLPCYVQCCMTY